MEQPELVMKFLTVLGAPLREGSGEGSGERFSEGFSEGGLLWLLQ